MSSLCRTAPPRGFQINGTISNDMRHSIFLAGFLAAQCSAATLEQYLNAPFASDLTAAPTGGRVAWVLNERGTRNIWTAEAPDWKGRRLTAYKDDDGADI